MQAPAACTSPHNDALFTEKARLVGPALPYAREDVAPLAISLVFIRPEGNGLFRFYLHLLEYRPNCILPPQPFQPIVLDLLGHSLDHAKGAPVSLMLATAPGPMYGRGD